MHNWFIAAFEEAGIWTREQAQHVSENIRNTIHKEKYPEAVAELHAILENGKFTKTPLVTKLEADVAELKARLVALEKPVKTPTVAETPKAK